MLTECFKESELNLMGMTIITVDTDGYLHIKAPYNPDFNKGLAARREIEIEDFDRETECWVVLVDEDDYEILEELIYETIGGRIEWR